jgi:hypothetical protein
LLTARRAGYLRDVRKNGTLPRIAVALLLAGTALAAIGCGGGSSATTTAADSSYLAAVTRAADVTDRVPGYKFTLTSTATVNGNSTTIGGSGALNERGSEGEMTIEVDGKRLEEVIDKPYIYVKLPSDAKTSVTHGKPWARTSLEAVGASFGDSTIGGGSSDPAQVLGYLKSAGTVTRIGSETVRGAPATRYHALIDLDRLAQSVPAAQRAGERGAAATLERISGSRTLPMDVWLDGDGRVARLSMTMSFCSPEGRVQDDYSIDLYDYARQPVGSPPPASQVVDLSSTVQSELSKSLASLSCG